VAPDSERIHGLSDDFLADKPKFAEIADDFIEFIRGAELVIHNAAFDVGFLNNELGLLQQRASTRLCGEVIDTLRMAREMRPGKKNNLNALCNEFGVDNSGRQVHGALLDAELLAEVYLAMTRGQNSLEIAFDSAPVDYSAGGTRQRPPLVVLRASDEELAEHERVLGEIARESKGNCLWVPGGIVRAEMYRCRFGLDWATCGFQPEATSLPVATRRGQCPVPIFFRGVHERQAAEGVLSRAAASQGRRLVSSPSRRSPSPRRQATHTALDNGTARPARSGAAAGLAAAAAEAPRGDGHPVLLLPGFMADEKSLIALKLFLQSKGYDVHTWGLGRNLGFRSKHASALPQKIRYLHHITGRKVSLVGWSLGGCFRSTAPKTRWNACARSSPWAARSASMPAAASRRRRSRRSTG
jgi:DNA polymerase-3 subunit epsilon